MRHVARMLRIVQPALQVERYISIRAGCWSGTTDQFAEVVLSEVQALQVRQPRHGLGQGGEPILPQFQHAQTRQAAKVSRQVLLKRVNGTASKVSTAHGSGQL